MPVDQGVTGGGMWACIIVPLNEAILRATAGSGELWPATGGEVEVEVERAVVGAGGLWL